MPLCRIPEEPNRSKYPQVPEGLVFPEALDFAKQEQTDPEEWKKHVSDYTKDFMLLGLELTSLAEGHQPQGQQPLDSQKMQKSVTVGGETYTLDFQMDTFPVAGVNDPDLQAVRHTVRFPSMEADFVFGGYNQIKYTSAIDKYMFQIDELQDLGTLEDPDTFAWASVVHTQDKLVPLFSVREFVTLDVCCKSENLLSNRSCYHPKAEMTREPASCCVALTNTYRYRVPLVYFQRVHAHLPTQEGEEPSCSVVQFQFSDVAGLIPAVGQVKAVKQFGLDNLSKTFVLLKNAQLQGLQLGKNAETTTYLNNPLHPT